MKKRLFTLIFAALLTCGCCISCASGSESNNNSSSTSDTSHSRPEQSGKTRNERIKAADRAAESALTACNAALTELNSSGENVSVEGWIDSDTSAATKELAAIRVKTAEIAGDIEEPYLVYVKNGVAVAAVALKVDFYGTYPAGLNYANYYEELGEDPSEQDVMAYAVRLSEGK